VPSGQTRTRLGKDPVRELEALVEPARLSLFYVCDGGMNCPPAKSGPRSKRKRGAPSFEPARLSLGKRARSGHPPPFVGEEQSRNRQPEEAQVGKSKAEIASLKRRRWALSRWFSCAEGRPRGPLVSTILARNDRGCRL
jgi:hypothetical protein